jgi:hypothetical protein
VSRKALRWPSVLPSPRPMAHIRPRHPGTRCEESDEDNLDNRDHGAATATDDFDCEASVSVAEGEPRLRRGKLKNLLLLLATKAFQI